MAVSTQAAVPLTSTSSPGRRPSRLTDLGGVEPVPYPRVRRKISGRPARRPADCPTPWGGSASTSGRLEPIAVLRTPRWPGSVALSLGRAGGWPEPHDGPLPRLSEQRGVPELPPSLPTVQAGSTASTACSPPPSVPSPVVLVGMLCLRGLRAAVRGAFRNFPQGGWRRRTTRRYLVRTWGSWLLRERCHGIKPWRRSDRTFILISLSHLRSARFAQVVSGVGLICRSSPRQPQSIGQRFGGARRLSTDSGTDMLRAFI